MSAPPPNPPANEVPVESVDRAVKALLKWKSMQSSNPPKPTKPEEEKLPLFSSDEFIYLLVTLKRIPEGRTNPFRFPLPHPLYSTDESSPSELCLFIDDRPGKRKTITSKDAKEKISSEKIPISKVIKFTKLKSDYKPFEAKRKLMNSYDLFLTDKGIVPLLPKALGKHFFLKKKIPIAVDLSHKNWKEQVEKICGSAFLFLNSGTCTGIRVARDSMGRDMIVENVMAAIQGAAQTVPRKWKNIRAIHLKFKDSLALPVYQSVPDMNLSVSALVKSEGIVEKKKRLREEKEGDESVKKQKKNVGKKGRIHEVRYMDEEADDGAASDDEEENDVLEKEMMSGDDDDEEIEEEAVKPIVMKKKKKEAKDLKPKKGSLVKGDLKQKKGFAVKGDLKPKKGSAVKGSKKKATVVEGETQKIVEEEKVSKAVKKTTSAVKKTTSAVKKTTSAVKKVRQRN